MTQAEVRLAKGNPHSVLEDGRWVYQAGGGDAPKASAYAVRFKEGKVRYIRYRSFAEQTSAPWLQGFTLDTEYASVLRRLGQPSHTSISSDGLERMVSYDKYNTFYTFEKSKVAEIGVFDPATGPMDYLPSESAPPASSARGG